jgi:anti-sigma factor RsiW
VLESLDQTSILLMYLSGELPARDRAEVERRLAADAGWRAELAQLQFMQAQFESEMASLDVSQRLAGQASAVGRIGRAMRQHKVASLSELEALAPRRVLYFPAWAYPIAAAAAVGLVYLAWWVHRPEPQDRPLPGNVAMNDSRGADTTPSDSSDPDRVLFAELEQSFEEQNPTQPRSLESLKHSEQELADLARAASDPLQVLFTDPRFTPDADE